LGLFEDKDATISKIQSGAIQIDDRMIEPNKEIPPIIVQILNTNQVNPVISNQLQNTITIDIDIQVVNNLSSQVKGDANYLLEEIGETDAKLKEALLRILEFSNDAKAARNSDEVLEKGWGRRLKNYLNSLGNAGEQIKNISDGAETLKGLFSGIQKLSEQVKLSDIAQIAGQWLSNL
jgi:hypothetical protein